MFRQQFRPKKPAPASGDAPDRSVYGEAPSGDELSPLDRRGYPLTPLPFRAKRSNLLGPAETEARPVLYGPVQSQRPAGLLKGGACAYTAPDFATGDICLFW